MTCLRFVALSAALASTLGAAKPLYITVPRAFGTHESPVVDVAFAEKGAVELRVLRPKDLSAFVRKQVNLRRAYEPPPTGPNPGRALSRGLNAVGEPGTYLLYALSPSFRQEVAPALAKRSTSAGGTSSRLREGAEKLVGIPPGMTVVRSEWLNLDLGGDERDYSVPGFDAYFGSSEGSGFEERRVELSPLPAGVYVLQLVQGAVEGQVVLVVSDLNVAAKQTDGELLVRVAGRDQAPKQGVQVVVTPTSGAPRVGHTDEKGEVRIAAKEPRLLVTATAGSDTALVDTDFYSTLSVTPDVFIYTDRPIYRPGDEVQFRGVLRQPDSFLARLFRPKSSTVEVRLESGSAEVARTVTRVDEFGSFHGKMVAPEGVEPGVFRVSARVDGPSHQAETRVQEYVKPTFYVELLTTDETVTPGQKLKTKLRARRYAGGAPKHTAYEVFLYRVQVDAPAWVDDAGLGGEGSAVTYGSVSTTEGTLSVPERLYSSVAARTDAAGAEDTWATAPKFDDQGEAEVEVDVPPLSEEDARKPFRYTLTIRARDDQGSFATGARSFFAAESDLLGAVRLSNKVLRPGAKASFAVRATTLSGKPYGPTQGSVVVELRRAAGGSQRVLEKSFTTDEAGVWRGEVSVGGAGVLEVRATLADKKGLSWSGAETALALGQSGEAVTQVPALVLDTTGAVLEPGQTAEVVALLPEGWGPRGGSSGSVWVTLSGTGLFSTQLVKLSGTTLVHRFDVEKRFGSAVYAQVGYPTARGTWEERTAAFRIVPKERTLTVALSPLRAEAAPLSQQTVEVRVVDASGRGVQAQLSVGVVDKAVYAVQSEFRPHVLEFFYPVGRDNVTSFYSAEFQGYGYGERLARLLGRVGHHAFAAIKPPTRVTRDKDTAYWNPSVLTDRDGRASVTFPLPSNQTLWTVTAVAADASGRFGEGTAEFASRGSLLVATALPLFLREGDQAQGSVRLAKGGAAKSAPQVSLDVQLSGPLTGPKVAAQLSLTGKDEQLFPLLLEAQGPGPANVTVAVKGEETLIERRRLPVEPAAVEDVVEVAAYGGGELALPLPEGATLVSAQLSLMPGVVDAALGSVHELLEYPYGCLEQLVATTVPNIALYRTLEKTGGLNRLDPASGALLAEARSRSVLGTQRILQLTTRSGGFTWFQGYDEPSLPMTLIALDGLSYAVEAGLVEKNDARLVSAASWLEAQGELPVELEAKRVYVLSRLQGGRQAANVRALLSRADATDRFSLALAVLAAEHAGIAKEPGLGERIQELALASREAFFQPAAWDSRREAFWRYPLRQVGYAAVLGHAASKGPLDVDKARRRFLELLSTPGLSTFDRSTAILHALWLIERDVKELKSLPAPSVSPPLKLAALGTGFSGAVDPSVRALKVGSFQGVAKLRAQVRTSALKASAREQGMALARRYLVLRGGQKKELTAGEAVAQGEEVFVELTLNAHASGASTRSAYYVVEDAVPAGFVPLEEDKAFRAPPYELPLAHEALRRRIIAPSRVAFMFEEPAFWSATPRTVGYVLRAQFPGRYVAPPARLSDMYATEVGARTAGATLDVKPSGTR